MTLRLWTIIQEISDHGRKRTNWKSCKVKVGYPDRLCYLYPPFGCERRSRSRVTLVDTEFSGTSPHERPAETRNTKRKTQNSDDMYFSTGLPNSYFAPQRKTTNKIMMVLGHRDFCSASAGFSIHYNGKHFSRISNKSLSPSTINNFCCGGGCLNMDKRCTNKVVYFWRYF